MSAKVGLDPERVTELADSAAVQLAALGGIQSELERTHSASLNPLHFGFGPGSLIIAQISDWIARSAGADLAAASAAGSTLLRSLAAQVREQQDASAGSAAAGSMTPARARELYNKVLADPTLLEDYTPEQVAAFWAALENDPAKQQALIDASPIVIGNLSGIPFDVRVKANVLNAQETLKDPNITPAMRKYLERVVDPDAEKPVKLVTFDPANERIVEMVGEITDDTTTVITYVPGTTSNMDTFYGGGVQQVSAYLVEDDPNAVAFVYKDGLFPGGSSGSLAQGIPEANDHDYAIEAGKTLANFEDDVNREPQLANATSVAIGHSWGLSNVTSSEVAGAHYDKVISLAGAWMPKEWEASPTTTYSSHTYADWLYLAQETGGVGDGEYPRSSTDFDRTFYDGPNEEISEVLGVKYPNPDVMISNHNLISTRSDDNTDVLLDVAEEIFGD